MRLIDADALLKKTINSPLHAPYITEKDIREMPTIQPVATDTNVGDIISRQAAIDAIFSEPLYKSGMKKRDVDVVVPAIYEKIKSLTSAQPTGAWLIHKWGDDAKCSNCEKTFKDVYDMDNYDQYCRHCGTHMKGVTTI